MNELELTKEYWRTLKCTYQRQGVARAFKHEVMSTYASIKDRLETPLLFPIMLVMNFLEFHGLGAEEDYILSFKDTRTSRKERVIQNMLEYDPAYDKAFVPKATIAIEAVKGTKIPSLTELVNSLPRKKATNLRSLASAINCSHLEVTTHQKI